MSFNTWAETLWVAPAAGPAQNTFTAMTSLLTNSTSAGPGKYTLPANFFNAPGKTLSIKAWGITTANTTNPTLTFQVAFGTINVFTLPALTANATQTVNSTWELEIDMVARAVGPSANVYGVARFTCAQYYNSVSQPFLLPATAPTTGLAFDGTTAFQIDLQASFSASSANNNIQIQEFRLVAMN